MSGTDAWSIALFPQTVGLLLRLEYRYPGRRDTYLEFLRADHHPTEVLAGDEETIAGDSQTHGGR